MSESSDLIMKYQEQAINTMSRGELIIRLYDELIKNLKYASIFLKKEYGGGTEMYWKMQKYS